MMTYIAPPQAFSGSEAQQLTQAYRYLFRLSEQLSQALSASEQQYVQVQQTAEHAGQSAKAELTGQYNGLKAQIIKTADAVRSEMDVLETKLRSEYIAISDWGTYEESIRADITATAQGIVQEYGYDAKIQSLEEDAVAFSSYIISSKGYIRQGIIGYDDNGLPIIGIAIGQDLSGTPVVIDGKEYDELDMTRNMATYTSDRIIFWQNGVEAGEFSNSTLTSRKIYAKEELGVGRWSLTDINGLTLKWIGE